MADEDVNNLARQLDGLNLEDAATQHQRVRGIRARIDGNTSRSHGQTALCDHQCLRCRESFPDWNGLRKHLKANRRHVLSAEERTEIKDEYQELVAIRTENGRLTRIQERRLLLVLYDMSQLARFGWT